MSDPLAIVPIRRSRISQEIVVQLCQMIRQGQLRRGDRLPPERELAERMQVSRASLREALRALEIAGIVVARQGGGTYIRETFNDGMISPLSLVLDSSDDLVGDLWEVRSIVEPAIAARAAVRARPEHLDELDGIVREQEGFMRRDVSDRAWIESDRAFHIGVARASENEVAIRVIQLLNDLLHKGRSHFGASQERRADACRWHRQIAEAIRAGEPQSAREAMLGHLREVENYILGEVIAPGAAQPTRRVSRRDSSAADTQPEPNQTGGG